MYSQDKINVALKVYHQCGSVTTIIRVLGYPTRRALYTWIANEGAVKPERKSLKLMNAAEHPRNPSIEVKMDAIHRCFELGESIRSASEDTGYTKASPELAQLQDQLKGMQMEIDILKETINV